MRLPSENLLSSVTTFHSRSEGGFFCGLLKNTSYSIFSRLRCDSSKFISSSRVMPSPRRATHNTAGRSSKSMGQLDGGGGAHRTRPGVDLSKLGGGRQGAFSNFT